MSDQPDIRAMSKKLRAQTCALLKFDPDKLSAGDEVLVGRVGALKLLVSDMEAAQLRGEKIDLAVYVSASRELEQVLRAPTEAGPNSDHSSTRARERLAELIGDLARERDRVTEWLKEENAKLRAEIAELRSAPKPQPEPEPPQPNNVVPLDGAARANGNKPPAHYLKEGQPREPWAETIVPSWSPPGGLDAVAGGEGRR
jgi:hypothetical protein